MVGKYPLAGAGKSLLISPAAIESPGRSTMVVAPEPILEISDESIFAKNEESLHEGADFP